jgi:BolA protein
VSSAFAGKNRLARHRLVYDPLSDWIPVRIHALSIDARDPSESR